MIKIFKILLTAIAVSLASMGILFLAGKLFNVEIGRDGVIVPTIAFLITAMFSAVGYHSRE
jgi:hypothetical protein